MIELEPQPEEEPQRSGRRGNVWSVGSVRNGYWKTENWIAPKNTLPKLINGRWVWVDENDVNDR